MLRVIWMAGASFLVMSCASMADRTDSVIYHPSEIVRAGNSMIGRRVRVAGYLKIGQDTRGLWDSREVWEQASQNRGLTPREVWGQCVTFYYDISQEQSVLAHRDSYIVVIATVGDTTDGSVDFWGCNDSYVTAHRIVSAGRGADHGPARR